MGHAGAIISAFGESADEKVDLLERSGATVVRSPADIGQTVAGALAGV
jgi:malate-CoA ligase subunit alpha